MNNALKLALVSGTVCSALALSSAVNAAQDNPYSSGFQKAYAQCEKLAQTNPNTGNNTYFAQDACYNWQVKMALTDDKACKSSTGHANRCANFLAQFEQRAKKAGQPQLLTAAVQAAPAYLADTVDAAMQSGMNTYDVVAVATAAYPQGENTIAQRAIAFGADPTQLLQATAAGHERAKETK